MADIYIHVGKMAYNSDTNKVGLKYAMNAQDLMVKAVKDAVVAATGFTLDAPQKDPHGYHIDLTLSEVVFGTRQGQPSVTCNLNGEIDTWPEKKLVTNELTGTATLIGGTTKRDVDDCITAATTATMNKSVLPALAKRP